MERSTKTLSLSQAAAEFGVPVVSLHRKLRNAKIPTHRGVTIAQCWGVLATGKEAERVREIRARADLLEMKLGKKRRNLVPLVEVQAMIRDAMIAVSAIIETLPQVAPQVNPADPQLAREALDRWVAETRPLLRGRAPAGANAGSQAQK